MIAVTGAIVGAIAGGALGGCAQQHAASFVGLREGEVLAKLGKPVRTYQPPDGPQHYLFYRSSQIVAVAPQFVVKSDCAVQMEIADGVVRNVVTQGINC
jgi:hypothetical protein